MWEKKINEKFGFMCGSFGTPTNSIVIPLEILNSIDYQEFKEIQNFNNKYGKAISLHEFGNECSWDAKYISINDILIIINSGYYPNEYCDFLISNYKKSNRIKSIDKLPGYIYIIYSKTIDAYKIGRTKNINKRIKAFRAEIPIKFEVIFSKDTMDMVTDEKTLHKIFREKRIKGEWFKLNSDDINYITTQFFNHKGQT